MRPAMPAMLSLFGFMDLSGNSNMLVSGACIDFKIYYAMQSEFETVYERDVNDEMTTDEKNGKGSHAAPTPYKLGLGCPIEVYVMQTEEVILSFLHT
jgi:hypothetical protein